MSYEVMIERAGSPTGTPFGAAIEQSPISLREWVHFLEHSKEFSIDYFNRLTHEETIDIISETSLFDGCNQGEILSFTKQQTNLLRSIAEKKLSGILPDMESIGADVVEWNTHPGNELRFFSFENGVISTMNPDLSTFHKMIDLASLFRAHLQGEDGEFYRFTEQNLECISPDGGDWTPFEIYHQGRPDWAPAVIAEINKMKL